MSFEKFFRPKSVAVVGASADPAKVGNNVLVNIIDGGYEGAIYPVNPKADVINGKKCYPSLGAIPGEVDLAVIVIKRNLVIPVLKQCAEKNIRAVIVITAGFAETGEEGRNLQREIQQIARENNMTLMGPNCLGLINPWHRLNAAFGQPLDKAGPIAMISQSGALIAAIQDTAASNGIGFSVLASLGNKATLDEVDFLHELQKDSHTRVIAAYLEDITRGQEFMKVAERVNKTKPIVILKAGRTSGGARAASSHTGSLAGSDSAYASAFERAGVIRVDSIEQLFDISSALAYQPLPAGNRIGVVTNAGGPGIMMTDAIEMEELKMATLDEDTTEALRKILPSAGSVANPVDVLGDAGGELYGKAAELLLKSDSVDGLIVILTPQTMTEVEKTAQVIVDVCRKYSKPVFACFMGADIVEKGIKILRENRIPQYEVPERAARAMREMVNFSRYKSRPVRVVQRFAVNKIPVTRIINRSIDMGVFEIGETDAKEIMRAYNFNVPSGMLAATVEDAVRFANQAGYPVVMKISSPDILHKSDVGGVKVGLKSPSEVEDAFELMMMRVKRRMPEAEIRGVLIEKMISGGREVILGMKKDRQFGPVLMYGLGGIFVEVLKDVSFALAPVTTEECFKMISRTRSYKLLTGARGEKPVDIPSIVTNLQRLSQLVIDFPEIEEVDINPLKVGQKGEEAFVVDARIILSKERG